MMKRGEEVERIRKGNSRHFLIVFSMIFAGFLSFGSRPRKLATSIHEKRSCYTERKERGERMRTNISSAAAGGGSGGEEIVCLSASFSLPRISMCIISIWISPEERNRVGGDDGDW